MNTTTQFVPILIVAFAIALGMTPLTRQIAMRLGIVDKPNSRKIHVQHTPLMGGLAIYVAFMISIVLFTPLHEMQTFLPILGGASILALLGFLDDRHDLSARLRLAVMVGVALWIVLSGVHIRLFNVMLIDMSLTVVWVVAIMNAVNFLDNMDGLSSGLSAISAGFFLLISISQGLVLVSMLSAALFGSAIGFLAYNFNPASTFMGDMGALPLGFVLAVIGIQLKFGIQPINVTWMVPIFALAMIIFDINLVVATRLSEGRSPGEAGKDHTSHRLMSMGLSQRVTVLLMYSLAMVFGGLALTISLIEAQVAFGIGVLGLVILVGLFIGMFWIRRRYQLNSM